MRECFKIENRLEIEIELINQETMEKVKIRTLVDTGFSGWVLVPYDIYKKVSSIRSEEELKTYGTIESQIKTRASRCLIRVGDMIFKGYVESPIFGRELTLVGRELISKLNVEIKKGKEICISDP